jgi:hypothetical protein
MPALEARPLDASLQRQIVIAHDKANPLYISRGQRTDFTRAAQRPQEQLICIDAVASGHHGHALSRSKALANHGQLLVDVPATSAFLAEQLPPLSLLLVISIPVCLSFILRGNGVLSFMGLVHRLKDIRISTHVGTPPRKPVEQAL